MNLGELSVSNWSSKVVDRVWHTSSASQCIESREILVGDARGMGGEDICDKCWRMKIKFLYGVGFEVAERN